MALQVFISGVRAGVGLGVARALRSGYPDARLVAVSYAHPGERIQWHDLTETWTAGAWHALDDAARHHALEERLAAGAWWLPGSAREAGWLAHTVGQHEQVLTPPQAALDAVRLPDVTASALLGLATPPSIRATATDWDLSAFGRRHGWRIWLRTTDSEDGPTQPIRSWVEFQQARLAMGERGFSHQVFLQRHISDATEAIAFAAYQGELLGSVLRADGPLAGAPTSRIDAAPESLTIALTQALRELRWTGGGEVQFVRDAADHRWLLGWRACFPAWISGAALAGVNLPARLLERATGAAPIAQSDMTPQFTRLVVEVPVFQQPAAHASESHTDAKDAPSPRSDPETPPPAEVMLTSAPRVAEDVLADVAAAAPEIKETPSFLYLPDVARRAFQHAEALSQRLSATDVRVRVAYSVKTNPDARLIELARATGLLAETISQLEVKKALACGVPAERIVLNGPAKRWRADNATFEPLHAVFCDSLEELQTAGDPCEPGPYNAEIVGVRLRTPGFASRFGIPLRDDTDVATIGQLVRRLPTAARFGVHFHMASNAIGLESWWRLFDEMLRWIVQIEAATARPVSSLDMGGGWFPDDWQEQLPQHFGERVLRRVSETLPRVRELILEPGRALAQSSMVLAVRVLEVRRERDGNIGDVVVDGSIAELAYHNYTNFPHRVLWRDAVAQQWRPMGRGAARMLGRLCMEKDILAESLAMPESLAEGDLLVICDAGAYDRSMSYSFGRG